MKFKFEITDEATLKLVGLGTAVHAGTFAAQPQSAWKWHYNEEKVPYDEAPAHHYAFALGGMAAQNLAVAFSDGNKEAKKNALKASGATWLVGAALLARNAHEGKSGQDKNFVYGASVGHVLLGALCLWRGFAKDSSWSKEWKCCESDKDE